MEINRWFENGCNYSEGVALYGTLKGHSINLLRLFLRKESISNAEKLKYELGKHRKLETTKTATPPSKETRQINLLIDVEPKTAKTQNNSFYRIHQLHKDLHPLVIKQRNDFQTAISLHSQLTTLHPDEEGAALALCIEIENLFDGIETAQKVLDHYVSHKVVLNIAPRSFSNLSPAQLIQSRNNKRVSVSKYKKRANTLKDKLGQNLSKSEKTKSEVAIEKSKNKLLLHELELQQLNELINKNE